MHHLVEYGFLVWIAFHVFVLLYEEPSLRSTFRAEFEAFRAKAPRWIPRPIRGKETDRVFGVMRLIPGILTLFVCIALALQNASAYVRHLDTGDQAGFSLGTFFLVDCFLPIAATLLLIGGILVAPAGAQRANRPLRIIALSTLIAGAVFFVAYAKWMTITFWHARHTETELLWPFVATILAFSATVLACALAFRPDSSSPRKSGARWLSGTMVILAVIVSCQLAAAVPVFISDRMLPIYLPFVAGPTLVWIAMLVWCAWRLSREGTVAKGGGPRAEGV